MQATDTAIRVRLDEVVIDCRDPELLAHFWSTALGFDICELEEDLASIDDPTGGMPGICFQRVPESKLVKNRVHFDLNVDEADLDRAVAHLVSMGATKLEKGYGDHTSWAVLADPEGNEFCVVS